MESLSLWHAIGSDYELETLPQLTESIEVDVAIIGAGITGLTAAQHLLRSGQTVAILEAYRVGDGTTGNSTGNLYIETQPYFQNIVKKFDLEIAKAVAHSRKLAIDEIEKNVQEQNINCNFSRRPWYIFTDKNSDENFLEQEVKTFQNLGIDINFVSDLPMPFLFEKAALMANQARLNPLKYVQGLAKNLTSQNCLIFENTKVINITDKKVVVITTEQGKVTAKKVIIATHTPKGINDIQLFTAPYRSYVMAVRFQQGPLPEGHFWGIGANQKISSTHAMSSDNQPELLLVAGSHHKTGQGDETSHLKDLHNYLKNQFPSFKIEHQWSAQHYQAADDLPYIGLASRSSKNSYIATGYFADGLVYGTIAGKLLSNLITGNGGGLADIYNPNRHTLGASVGFVTKENANVFMEYLKDLPLMTSKHYEDIQPGDGVVVEIDSEKCGVSRDNQNRLHIVSAVCSHMKCIVKWNHVEKSWDCPCHGSRFSPEGKVLEGPAILDLTKKQI